MEPNPSPFDLWASLRRIAETTLGTIQNRIQLFALELAEEKCWLISTLLWLAALIFFGGLAIMISVGAIVFLVPVDARGWVLGGFALFFIVISVVAGVRLRQALRDREHPLSHTVDELKKDLECLRPQD